MDSEAPPSTSVSDYSHLSKSQFSSLKKVIDQRSNLSNARISLETEASILDVCVYDAIENGVDISDLSRVMAMSEFAIRKMHSRVSKLREDS